MVSVAGGVSSTTAFVADGLSGNAWGLLLLGVYERREKVKNGQNG